MKSFRQFIEDIQASSASNASVEDMETGELLGVGNEYPRRKKKKIAEGDYERETHNWSEHDHELWKDKKHLRPAIRNRKTGEIHIGKVGDIHRDLLAQHNLGGAHDRDDGMYHMKTKQFHSGSAIDSTDLMSKMQRIRKFGNEETEIERLSLEEFLAEEYS